MKIAKLILAEIVQSLHRIPKRVDADLDRVFFELFRLLHRVKPLHYATTPFYKKVVYGRHRVTAFALAVLMLTSMITPAYADYRKDIRYTLNTSAQTLIGEANQELASKLTLDAQTQTYQFNKEGRKDPSTAGNPVAELQSKIGGASKTDEQQYSLDVPIDLSQGITYYDNQAQLSFKMVPQFKTMPGKLENGHLVYPLLGTNGQVAYTVGAKGLKENMVLYESPGDTLTRDYKLELPLSLEARIIPGSGDLGIYSADPALFGNISYGSSSDQEKVEQARNNSEKTFLTFRIPAPFAVGLADGKQTKDTGVQSEFNLNGDVLSVKSKGLDQAQYPLSIDPSVDIDSTSDFNGGNFEDANSDVANGSLARGALTGGALGSFSTNSPPPPVSFGNGAVATYNGFVYMIGGNQSNTNVATIRYAPIGTSSIGGWTTTTPLTAPRLYHTAAVYNGYLYVLGGTLNDGTTLINTVQYIKINSDGSLDTTWKTAPSLPTVRYMMGVSTYNGYLYVTGGCSATSLLACDNRESSVLYTVLNADGSIGAWQTTASLNTGRWRLTTVVNNGYIYAVAGENNGVLGSVEYAAINSNGTLRPWAITTPLVNPRSEGGVTIKNGYMYVFGGNPGDTSMRSDTQYVAVNADGTLGAWSITSSFTSTRYRFNAFTSKDYIFLMGGCTSVTCSSFGDSIELAKISPAGGNSNTATNPTNLATQRYGQGSVAYNGYVYTFGGFTTGSGATSEVLYTPINANGSLGTFANANTGTPFTARTNVNTAVYNGYVYVMGGVNNSGVGTNEVFYALLCTGVNNGVGGCGTTPGMVGTWTTTNALNANRALAGATVNNGYIYTSGGCTTFVAGSCTAYSQSVSYALICNGLNNGVQGCNATAGSLGTWTFVAGNNYTPTPRGGNSMVAYNGYMYILGGYDNTVFYNDARYALICTGANSGVGGCGTTAGDTGTWANAYSGAAFTTPRANFGGFVNNGVLYVTGGNGAAGIFGDTQYAAIGANGLIGSWTAGPSMTTARYQYGSAFANGVMYFIGGLASGGNVNTIEYMRIGNGGPGNSTIATISPQTITARTYHGSVAYNGYLYVVGGCVNGNVPCNTATANTQYAKINADGTLGTWATAGPDFATSRANLGAALHNGYIYITGGLTTGATTLTDTQYAKINADGTLGAWVVSPNTFPFRYGHTSEAYNGKLYVTGGNVTNALSNNVLYANINPDGSIGAWTATTSLPSVRVFHTSTVYNGYMYIAGGCGATDLILGCTANLSDVFYSKINSDGTLGAWNRTNYFFGGRYVASMTAHNGYMYMVGGYHGSTGFYSDTQVAPINSDGGIGQWQRTSHITANRAGQATLAVNGYMYSTGGLDGNSTILNTVLISGLNSIARKTTYSKLIDFKTPTNIKNVTFDGVLPGGVSNIKYRTTAANGTFNAYKSSTASMCSELEASSMVQVFVTVDDSQVGVFTDANNAANNAILNSITVVAKTYTPPAKRLRHSASFHAEKQQAFNTDTITCTQ